MESELWSRHNFHRKNFKLMEGQMDDIIQPILSGHIKIMSRTRKCYCGQAGICSFLHNQKVPV